MCSVEEIIKGCKNYNKHSQKILYDKYAPKMKAICLRYAHNSYEAGDILQDGFIKVFANIRQFEAKGSFEGWIKRIIVNTAITHYHQNQKHQYHAGIDEINERNILHADEENDVGADKEIDRSDINENRIDYSLIKSAEFSREELLGALNRVPENFRIVFNMFAIEEYSHKEIAQLIGIDENTSRTRLLRAKKILQEELYKMSIDKLSR
ncbi:MAG: RNA polymerase sigma factor [Bacteroidia bacterium]|nr:RNA polymerase sigma factor [Bacteroidia bacterium]